MRRFVPIVLLLALAAGCGSASGSGSGSGGTGGSTSANDGDRAALTAGLTAARRLPTKVLVVIEENHSLRQMRAQMPYLAGLSDRYGYATDWHALTHPSLPNYLAIAGGSTFGVTNDADPSTNAAKLGRAASVFSQARRAGRSAATYAESMPHHCNLTSAGHYAVRHNPWTYFSADRTACRAHDVGTANLAANARANKLANVTFLIPNLVHDAHDATLAQADAWLKTHLAPVLASSDFTSGRLAVVVIADEDDRLSGNKVLTSVLSTRLDHKVVRTALNHYSLTRFIEQVLGVGRLRNARTAPDMATAFGF